MCHLSIRFRVLSTISKLLTMSFTNNFSKIRIDKKKLDYEMMKFTLSLYENPMMSNDDVQFVFEKFDNFLSNLFIPFIQNQIELKLRQSLNDDNYLKVQFILEDSKSIFFKFSSEYRRLQEYQTNSIYIPPVVFPIGSSLSYHRDDLSNLTVTNANLYAVHIPLKPTLENFFSKPGVFQQIQKYVAYLSE